MSLLTFGRAVAFPCTHSPARSAPQPLQPLHIFITRLQPEPEESAESAGQPSIFAGIINAIKWATGFADAAESQPKKGPRQDEWKGSMSRHNRMVSLKLAINDPADGGAGSSAEFCIATYHMPCAFYDQKLMVVHTALAAQHALRVAGGLPLVLCGDWNFKPGDASYNFMTTGELDAEDPAYPNYLAHDPWRIEDGMVSGGLSSAYVAVNGKEPPFTNYAQTVRDDEPFIDTLDYFFCSDHVTAIEVEPTPESTDESGRTVSNERAAKRPRVDCCNA